MVRFGAVARDHAAAMVRFGAFAMDHAAVVQGAFFDECFEAGGQTNGLWAGGFLAGVVRAVPGQAFSGMAVESNDLVATSFLSRLPWARRCVLRGRRWPCVLPGTRLWWHRLKVVL